MKNLLLLFDGIHLEGGIPTAAFYAVFGFLFVFAGITIMIAILSLLGFAMEKFRGRKKKETPVSEKKTPRVETEEGIPPEVVAAITAAIAVYTQAEETKCEFVVRRIRKI